MKITITFISAEDGGYVTYKPGEMLGLLAGKLAINHYDAQGIEMSIGQFEPYVGELILSEVNVRVPVEDAARIPHAYLTSRIHVSVPAHSLNQYVDLGFYIDHDAEDNDVIVPIWEVNKEALMNEWRNAGYPLSWDPTPADEEDPGIDADLDSTITIVGSMTFHDILRSMIRDMGYKRTLRALDLVEEELYGGLS